MSFDGDRSDWRGLNRQTRRGFLYVAKWIVASVALIALLSVGWVKLVSPVLLDADAEIRRESHQYVETQRTFLLQKLSAINDLEADISEATDPKVVAAKEAQIKAFTREITERVELIDKDEVPDSVLDYLEELDK